LLTNCSYRCWRIIICSCVSIILRILLLLLLLITQPSCVLLSLIIRIASRMRIIGLSWGLRIIRTTSICTWTCCCCIPTSCCCCCCCSTKGLCSCSSLGYFDRFPLKNWSIHFWDCSPDFRWVSEFYKPKSFALLGKWVDDNLSTYRCLESAFKVIQQHGFCHVRLQFTDVQLWGSKNKYFLIRFIL